MMALINDWHIQMSAILSLCSFFFCLGWVKPRFGLSASLLMAFCCYSAIYVWAWKDNRYLTVNIYDQMALRYFACDSIAKIMMVCVPMMLFMENRDRAALFGQLGAACFALVSCLIVIVQSHHGCDNNNCGGLIGNPSISLGLTVCMLPVFIRYWKRQWLVLSIVALAVFISKSSIAVGLLAAYGCLCLFPWKAFSIRKLFWMVAAIGGIFGIAYKILGSEFLNDSDRFKIWRFMFERWRAPWNIIAGTGLGSYHVFSVNLQHMQSGIDAGITQNGWWDAMHNDWLEMLFCGGILGVILMISTYGSALLKLYREKDWHLLMSAVLFGLYMFLDPVLRSPIPILFGAWLFTYALRKDNIEAKLL